jgi:glycosyltransferase involved in cell wall biosynthesis
LKITVVLCTYNRCHSLPKALDSVAASQLPDTVEWEVVVVDNNSTDQTREVVESFCRRYTGRFHYLYERQQGLSFARNAGVRGARGEIIAFTDDDLTVDPKWLFNLTGALDNGEWAGAGGRILPAEVFSLPRWLALDGPYGLAGPLYAGFDMGDRAHELKRPPHGACMAFRKSMFAKYGDFRTDLGASPGSALGNEDTEFGHRLMVGGERLRYEPLAVVYHEISKKRVSKGFFLNWWFDFGRAQVREAGKRPAIWGIPRHYITIPNVILTHLPKRTLQWLVALSPQKRFYRKCMVWIVAGWLAETRRLAKSWKSHAIPSTTRNNKQEASS